MTQPAALEERLRAGDQTLVRLPLLGSITYNEAHAGLLGAAHGLALVWSPIARRTIRREPWWFAGLVLAAVALEKLR
ncbi:hypothetical protein [Natrinema pallidum]|uniref:Uncharacterized protein n=1 Tax=Natrinema pallidum TaxID=69527 RepID=A0A4P9TFT6_9EURY|nr:hypothetical protein [Natrinema pallidum]QCW03557.1 hypothetical protein FGF80_10035 [Natrinema pallidum]